MAIYEYACIECDLDYEKERSIHDAEQKYYCDQCGYALQRVYNSFGIQFKGGGFYSTDSRGQLQLGSSSLATVAATAAPDAAVTTMS